MFVRKVYWKGNDCVFVMLIMFYVCVVNFCICNFVDIWFGLVIYDFLISCVLEFMLFFEFV